MLNFHSIEINYLGVGLPVSSVLFDADQVSAIMLFILKKKSEQLDLLVKFLLILKSFS